MFLYKNLTYWTHLLIHYHIDCGAWNIKESNLQQIIINTPWTAGGPGGRDRTLARCGRLGLARCGRLKQKTEKKEERLNDGNNNGQATHGARKHAWRTQAAWANRNCRAR